MKVVIESPNIELTGALNAFVSSRMRIALARYTCRIERVHVRLCDLSPRPGVDKYCLAELFLTPRGKLLVEVTDTAIEPAVLRAAERAARRMAVLADERFEVSVRPDGGVAA